MKSFFHAVAFLTRLPVPKLSSAQEDWLKSAPYYPFVGLIIGGLLVACASLLSPYLSAPVVAVLTLMVWVYITGGLHLDGWMDLADGLGSYRSREEVLRIMKDSRVGAMGVTAAILLLLLKATLLYELIIEGLHTWLLLLPIAGRLFLVISMRCWPYLSTQGLGHGMREKIDRWKLGLGFIITCIVSFGVCGMIGVVALLITLLAGWWMAHRIVKRLGGLTGDGYGALVEGCETACALFLLLTWRWIG
ncbi:adenosylcobinamide-GDP ribazoletransferase [Ammoniphilus sp. YIM 78166]|uniref:adenosylcobinamide-GDP ribazoletransferase n=1 Tax=Ammoniphilus sp. YIM 78166 TaxID=1644106 RepID=UPI0010702FC0|nr:adenosylcobinamide-GDP ribazoletransferase [Ammoniphilus sp. YIM 78166]